MRILTKVSLLLRWKMPVVEDAGDFVVRRGFSFAVWLLLRGVGVVDWRTGLARSLLTSVILRPTTVAAATAVAVVGGHAVVGCPCTLSQTILNHRFLSHAILSDRIPPHTAGTHGRVLLTSGTRRASSARTDYTSSVRRPRERPPGTHVANTLLRTSGTQNTRPSMLRKRLHRRVSELNRATARGQLGWNGWR